LFKLLILIAIIVSYLQQLLVSNFLSAKQQKT
jgi:hypothetical protein